LWVVRVRFEPGVTIQRHKHTGEVFGFTLRVPGNISNTPRSTLPDRTSTNPPDRCTPCTYWRTKKKSPMPVSPYAGRT
jgi:hypothetical protein